MQSGIITRTDNMRDEDSGELHSPSARFAGMILHVNGAQRLDQEDDRKAGQEG